MLDKVYMWVYRYPQRVHNSNVLFPLFSYHSFSPFLLHFLPSFLEESKLAARPYTCKQKFVVHDFGLGPGLIVMIEPPKDQSIVYQQAHYCPSSIGTWGVLAVPIYDN